MLKTLSRITPHCKNDSKVLIKLKVFLKIIVKRTFKVYRKCF